MLNEQNFHIRLTNNRTVTMAMYIYPVPGSFTAQWPWTDKLGEMKEFNFFLLDICSWGIWSIWRSYNVIKYLSFEGKRIWALNWINFPFDAFFCKMNHLRGLWAKLNDMVHVKFSIQWLIYILDTIQERYYYYWNKGKKNGGYIELDKRFIQVFPNNLIEKPEWTFWPTQ